MSQIVTIDGKNFTLKPITFGTLQQVTVFKNKLSAGEYDAMRFARDNETLISLDCMDFEAYTTVFLPDLEFDKLFNTSSGKLRDMPLENFEKMYDVLEQIRAIINPQVDRITKYINAKNEGSKNKAKEEPKAEE